MSFLSASLLGVLLSAAGNAAGSQLGDVPAPLLEARKLSDALRYEEAAVEYQRYLSLKDRPAKERALALFELGFVHLVLGDEATAADRANAALELDVGLTLPAGAPAREVDFLAQSRREHAQRPRIAMLPKEEKAPPSQVRVQLVDPMKRVKRLLLRHALSSQGPYWSSPMQCEPEACTGFIPPPSDGSDFTAWYFVEALDEKQNTLAFGASATEPLQLSVVGSRAWYKSPIVWGVTGAALVAVGAVVYLLSPPPPR